DAAEYDLRAERDQFRRTLYSRVASQTPAIVDAQIAADSPSRFLQSLHERSEPGLRLRFVRCSMHEDADAPYPLTLRVRRERPCSDSAADQRDELAPPIKKIRSHGTVARVSVGPKYHHPPRTYCFHPARVGGKPVDNSFDHLVGDGEKRRWNRDAKHPRGLGVDDQLELRRLHDRQVRRLCALEDAADIAADLASRVVRVASVAHQPPNFGVVTP